MKIKILPHNICYNQRYNFVNMAQTRKQSGAGIKKEKIRSRIRSVGNSKGVILNNQLLKAAGISTEEDISIEAGDGLIIISQAKPAVNTDLSTWDAQFKKAIKAGHLPEGDLFEGLENEFDKTEW
jgi:antitoxin component of MazEF toxin-antitoxin module